MRSESLAMLAIAMVALVVGGSYANKMVFGVSPPGEHGDERCPSSDTALAQATFRTRDAADLLQVNLMAHVGGRITVKADLDPDSSGVLVRLYNPITHIQTADQLLDRQTGTERTFGLSCGQWVVRIRPADGTESHGTLRAAAQSP